jgi:cephalosporin hydroxylase
MRPWLLSALGMTIALAVGIGLGSWLAGPPGGVVAAGPKPTVASPACPDELVLKRFHELWYGSPSTWRVNTWMGITTMQNPMDVWIVQELVVATRPDFIIECGSFHGGSAALWAALLEQVSPEGRVISIDIEDRMADARELRVVRDRVDFLLGSSTAPEIVGEVARRVQGRKVLVVLDSLHTKAHVLEELKSYSPLVQVGGYIVVEDTNINGHPVRSSFGPGPNEAVAEFLATNDAFVADRDCERLLFTENPGGFLKRVR